MKSNCALALCLVSQIGFPPVLYARYTGDVPVESPAVAAQVDERVALTLTPLHVSPPLLDRSGASKLDAADANTISPASSAGIACYSWNSKGQEYCYSVVVANSDG